MLWASLKGADYFRQEEIGPALSGNKKTLIRSYPRDTCINMTLLIVLCVPLSGCFFGTDYTTDYLSLFEDVSLSVVPLYPFRHSSLASVIGGAFNPFVSFHFLDRFILFGVTGRSLFQLHLLFFIFYM